MSNHLGPLSLGLEILSLESKRDVIFQSRPSYNFITRKAAANIVMWCGVGIVIQILDLGYDPDHSLLFTCHSFSRNLSVLVMYFR